MSPVERDAYREALEPWKRRAEREGKAITHVRYQDGHAEVTLEPRAAPPLSPEPGLL